MLQNIDLFDGLNETDLAVLEQHCTTRQYPANTILINEGDETDSMYVILAGEAKVFMSDDSGKEVTLNILADGDYFGELALLDDMPRSASVMTMQPSKLLVISKTEFRRCLGDHPEIATNIIRCLSQRVRSLTHSVKSLALMDVYGRVARTLLELAKENEEGKLVVRQKLTHQDIASMVGASREMVSRIMKDLSTGGYISVKNRQITIEEKLPPGW